MTFDNLCATCATLFDENVTWETIEDRLGWYRSHHDIYSLCKSAESHCHLCNMILGLFSQKTVETLQSELDDSLVKSSEQIRVRIKWESRRRKKLVLLINALSDLAYRDEMVRKLEIQYVENDRSNGHRSLSFATCSDDTISQITSWLDSVYRRTRNASKFRQSLRRGTSCRSDCWI